VAVADEGLAAQGEDCLLALEPYFGQAYPLRAQELGSGIREAASHVIHDGAKKHAVLQANVQVELVVDLTDLHSPW